MILRRCGSSNGARWICITNGAVRQASRGSGENVRRLRALIDRSPNEGVRIIAAILITISTRVIHEGRGIPERGLPIDDLILIGKGERCGIVVATCRRSRVLYRIRDMSRRFAIIALLWFTTCAPGSIVRHDIASRRRGTSNVEDVWMRSSSRLVSCVIGQSSTVSFFQPERFHAVASAGTCAPWTLAK